MKDSDTDFEEVFGGTILYVVHKPDRNDWYLIHAEHPAVYYGEADLEGYDEDDYGPEILLVSGDSGSWTADTSFTADMGEIKKALEYLACIDSCRTSANQMAGHQWWHVDIWLTC
mgnify:CR=1 FL=1